MSTVTRVYVETVTQIHRRIVSNNQVQTDQLLGPDSRKILEQSLLASPDWVRVTDQKYQLGGKVGELGAVKLTIEFQREGGLRVSSESARLSSAGEPEKEQLRQWECLMVNQLIVAAAVARVQQRLEQRLSTAASRLTIDVWPGGMQRISTPEPVVLGGMR